MNTKKGFQLIAVLLVVLCLLAGCTAPAAPADTDAPTDPVSTPDTTAPDATDAPTEPTEAGFRFTRDNFPRMDGSTALVPMAEAVACVMLGESREDVQDLVQFNRTTQSYRNLAMGECDLLFASWPNAAVFDELAEQGFEIEMEEVAMEGLIFLVNEDNPVNSLTTEQIRGIYSGEITNWKEVGGNDVEIVAFQRNEGAGSQALMRKLVMGDTEMAEAPAEYIVGSMGGLMECVKSYDNSANAIGYSVYYYANDMEMATGLKLIAVDGVEPNRDTIREGTYPHTNAYYCVIPASAPAGSPNRLLFEWVVTDEGQALIASEGYVSVKDVRES